MEMITVECPKCKGSLHVDQDVDKIFCMYCRAEVTVKKSTSGGTATSESLIKRGFLLIEHRDWEKALEVLDQAANIDPENAQIYLGMLLAETRIEKESWLDTHKTPLSRYKSYQKVIRFADSDLKQRLKAYNTTITKRLEENKRRSEEQQKIKNEQDRQAALLELKRQEKIKAELAKQLGLVHWIVCTVKATIYAFLIFEGLNFVINGIFAGDFFLMTYDLITDWDSFIGGDAWFGVGIIAVCFLISLFVTSARRTTKIKEQIRAELFPEVD